MRVEEIRERLRAQPFRPLRVFLSDGSVHEIPHPELAWLTAQHLAIGRNIRPDGLPRNSIYCDPLHVTRIEPATLDNGDEHKN